MLLILMTSVAAMQAPPLRTLDFTSKPVVTITEPFISPAGFTELAGNRAVIVDQKDYRLAFVDFTKNSVRNIGRQGSGPLEYRRISDLWALPNGSALLPDPANNRALFIAPDGSLSPADYSRQVLQVAGPGGIKGVDHDGRLYLRGSVPATGERDSFPIIRWAPITHHADTLAWWPALKVSLGPEHKLPDGTTVRALISQMFADQTDWAVLPTGGVAIIRPDPYRVEIVDAHGARHMGPIVARERIRIDAAERDTISKDRSGRAGGIPDAEFPPSYPPFEGVGTALVAPNGTIWIERSRRLSDNTAVYDVFDATGRLTAQAKLRPNSKILGLGKNFVYIARQTTDDDYWHLEQWRLPN